MCIYDWVYGVVDALGATSTASDATGTDSLGRLDATSLGAPLGIVETDSDGDAGPPSGPLRSEHPTRDMLIMDASAIMRRVFIHYLY